MAAVFRKSTLNDADRILELMLEAYGAQQDVYFNNHELFRWKYFQPGPTWVGSRGYVIETSGRVAAHLGACPVAFTCKGTCIAGAALMDWIGDPQLPGLGAALLRKVLGQSNLAVVAGGSEATQKILPRFGFTRAGELRVFAKPVRPFHQFRNCLDRRSKRDVARLARNFMWGLGPPATDGWSARRVQQLTADALVEPEEYLAPLRTTRFLNYWLTNPVAEVSGYLLERRGQLRGYFVLSRVEHQNRIVDLRIRGAENDWTAAFATASRAAIADPDTYEIVASSSTPVTQIALSRCGFRHRRTTPLFLCDPRCLFGSGQLHWNLIDDDSGYIRYPGYPYET